MDPTANAQELYRLATKIQKKIDDARELDTDDVDRLTELAISLIDWMANGGFSPKWDLVRDVIARCV